MTFGFILTLDHQESGTKAKINSHCGSFIPLVHLVSLTDRVYCYNSASSCTQSCNRSCISNVELNRTKFPVDQILNACERDLRVERPSAAGRAEPGELLDNPGTDH